MPAYQENPETELPLLSRMVSRFNKCGRVLPTEQETIYRALQPIVRQRSVLEAGCGLGFGAAFLSETAQTVIATDKVLDHVRFGEQVFKARKNLGWLPWDITSEDCSLVERDKPDVVICIEVIEHISDWRTALKNLKSALRADSMLFISSPNRNHEEFAANQDRPLNPHHVREWTGQEFFDAVSSEFSLVSLYDKTLTSKQDPATTTESPLIAICRMF